MIDNLSKNTLYTLAYYTCLTPVRHRVWTKAGAKLLLFYDMTKFSRKFFTISSQIADFQTYSFNAHI